MSYGVFPGAWGMLLDLDEPIRYEALVDIPINGWKCLYAQALNHLNNI